MLNTTIPHDSVTLRQSASPLNHYSCLSVTVLHKLSYASPLCHSTVVRTTPQLFYGSVARHTIPLQAEFTHHHSIAACVKSIQFQYACLRYDSITTLDIEPAVHTFPLLHNNNLTGLFHYLSWRDDTILPLFFFYKNIGKSAKTPTAPLRDTVIIAIV
jgi:hypothetical protein